MTSPRQQHNSKPISLKLIFLGHGTPEATADIERALQDLRSVLKLNCVLLTQLLVCYHSPMQCCACVSNFPLDVEVFLREMRADFLSFLRSAPQKALSLNRY